MLNVRPSMKVRKKISRFGFSRSSVLFEGSLNKHQCMFKYFSSQAIDNVKISSSGMNSDIHASSEYRANMVKALAKKAVEAC